MSADDDGGGEADAGDMDPLAEEMLRMMEEEGDDSGGAEDVDQMMEAEMLKAKEEEGGTAPGAPAGLALAGGGAAGLPPNIERLMDVRLTVTIELGRTRKIIQDVMELGDQSLIELEKTVGEPVDVLVNGELFARGEVVTVSENFGVRVTELVNPLPRI
jgi:flagellar motor switch protein FliN/FliY